MRSIRPSAFLKTVLIADAAASGAVAVLQLVAANWLSQRSMLPHALLVGTGAFLVIYAAMLTWLARRTTVWSAVVGTVVLGNVAWAVACVALVLGQASTLSGLGVAFVAVHAVAVLLFAALEYSGLRASTPERRAYASATS